MRTHILREPAQSKCSSTCQKNNFIQKFTGKMPQIRINPERGHTFCASLRSRNASEHFTRATLYGEKCCGPAGAPWSSTGLYNYRKNPSVWTHCLVNDRSFGTSHVWWLRYFHYSIILHVACMFTFVAKLTFKTYVRNISDAHGT